ncbi:MFS transporter [Neobacillus sp. SM06]|uniref:MFS transporter n=1 Tax=Neobacillus sp. SM06 TaxID=3422492 RepID=UPI003D2BF577
MTYIQKGTKEFLKARFALFIGGFVSFSILYTTQPLLPALAKEFHVSASLASLSLSLSTGMLAVAMMFAAVIADSFGKKKIMVLSMMLTSCLGFLTAFSPNFITLLAFRALLGIFVAGVPSIAMAYVAEEFHPRSIGEIMGLYVGGTSIGGMAGRMLTGFLTDLFSWRTALAVTGLLAFLLSCLFYYILPSPRKTAKKMFNWKTAVRGYRAHLINKSLMALILLAFLLMGSFVTLYNYIGFQLVEPPYRLSQTVIGFIFVVYLFGTFSSVYMGRKADAYGNPLVLKISLGIMIAGGLFSLLPSLIGKIAGISVFTFGFFASHSIASAWVGERSGRFKAQASSLYLLFYYLGSSFIGAFGGYFWTSFKWPGVVSLITILLLIGFPLLLFAQKDEQRRQHGTDLTKGW